MVNPVIELLATFSCLDSAPMIDQSTDQDEAENATVNRDMKSFRPVSVNLGLLHDTNGSLLYRLCWIACVNGHRF